MADRRLSSTSSLSSDRAADRCCRPPGARRMSAPPARGRALLCPVGDPSPLNPVRVESGSRGESLRIMADKPARPLGFGQSRRATPATRASAPVLRPGAFQCPIATRPRPAPPHPNLTRYSPNLRGDALQQSSHKSPVFKMKHFSQTINRRAEYPRQRRSARPLGGVGASVPCVSASPWADKGHSGTWNALHKCSQPRSP
jgi:hypothetical protein